MVTINDILSNENKIIDGVPQSSELDLVLFILYINKICDICLQFFSNA